MRFSCLECTAQIQTLTSSSTLLFFVPDMQPITLLIPRALMASTMFLVPSDITVVGPDEHRIIYFMYNIFPFGKLCVS